jgi:cell division septal protein FtsQ
MGGSGPRPARTKAERRAEKKALARKRREERRRRELRARFLRTYLVLVLVSGVIALALAWWMQR